MGHFEEFRIDRSEAWKYQTTLESSAEGFRAKVWVDDDGNISKDSYSREYNKKIGNNDKPDKKGKEKKGKSGKGSGKKESFLTKVIKAPFRFLWWLIKLILKNALGILTFGITNGWFDKKED